MGKYFLAALVAGYLAAIFRWPTIVGIGSAVLIVLTATANDARFRRLRNLARSRRGEDIGTFARALLPHSDRFDSWIVRATWDALAPFVAYRNGPFPLRPSDRLYEDLLIDPEDVALELLEEIAVRAGRSLDDAESNPMFGKIERVGHIVQFLERQPLIEQLKS